MAGYCITYGGFLPDINDSNLADVSIGSIVSYVYRKGKEEKFYYAQQSISHLIGRKFVNYIYIYNSF